MSFRRFRWLFHVVKLTSTLFTARRMVLKYVVVSYLLLTFLHNKGFLSEVGLEELPEDVLAQAFRWSRGGQCPLALHPPFSFEERSGDLEWFRTKRTLLFSNNGELVDVFLVFRRACLSSPAAAVCGSLTLSTTSLQASSWAPPVSCRSGSAPGCSG